MAALTQAQAENKIVLVGFHRLGLVPAMHPKLHKERLSIRNLEFNHYAANRTWVSWTVDFPNKISLSPRRP